MINNPSVSRSGANCVNFNFMKTAEEWRELALASMKVCYYRPHPREWWDDEMKDEALKEYETAMRTVRELKAKLGLENDGTQRPVRGAGSPASDERPIN